jgi:hypothetical protein
MLRGGRISSADGLVSVSITQICALPSVQPTYDLTVEGEHEFFANGILVHNCFKMILGTVRNPTEVPQDELIAAQLVGLDAFSGGMRHRFLMSQEAMQGKLGLDGKPKGKKKVPAIDMRRAPGVLRRPR